MKSLSIPFLPELNSITVDQASDFLDENGARISVEAINWPEKFGYKPLTTVCVAFGSSAIYILFQVHGNCLRAANTEDNQNVNEDSCVEFFVKQEDSDSYFNFEFNCIGICKAAKHVKDRHHFTHFTKEQLR
ncbi:MAG: carbohydrate-binding family 9-like protein, partial [Bacteroidales bacterium]|nr:carbohydrate-binding family 9-like protein [Bacteroidales bacterium]